MYDGIRLVPPGTRSTRGFINFTSGSKVPTGDNPAKVARTVNPYFFNWPGRMTEEGSHYGWVFVDFVDLIIASELYRTNFPWNPQGCWVTYKNGDEVIEKRETVVEVALEQPVLHSDLSPYLGKGFAGWKDAETGRVYKIGEKVTFEKNTVLEAQWEFTWRSLKEAIEGDDADGPTRIILDADITATDEDSEIIIARAENLEPADVYINLNGHKIDASSHGGDTDRRIFQVPTGSALTIDDRSGTGAGLLTGGCAEKGGAILVCDGADLRLQDVTLSGNHATREGGAIEALNGAYVSLNNTSITGNTAAEAGAGIFYEQEGLLDMEGNVQIHGNTLTEPSNAVLKGAESNLFVNNSFKHDRTDGFFTVIDALDPESEIGVSLARGTALGVEQVITIDLNGNGSVNSIRSDMNRYEVLNRNGEAVFTGKLLGVDYDPNDACSGTVPLDPNSYQEGNTATVLGNTGRLVFPGRGFIGWNTKADGSGTMYREGNTFTIEEPVTLYAQGAAASVTTQDGVTTVYSEFKDAVKNWGEGSTLTLLGDVTTDEIIYVRQYSATLDLNGYGITRVQKDEWDNARTVLLVFYDRTLTMKDSAPDRTWSGENRPAGVTGGYITGGYAHGGYSDDCGGGVLVQGTFNMEGGTITGNYSVRDGGGVYVYGTFRMSGGAVTGNGAGYYNGGGVFVQTGGTIEVSGSARIENNTRESGPVDNIVRKPNNLYLKKGCTIKVGQLADGASFGVSMQEPGVFTTGALFADDVAAQAVFTSDNDAYTVQRTDDGQGTLLKKEAVTYLDHTVDGSTATAVTGRCEG